MFSIILIMFFVFRIDAKGPCDSSWLHLAHMDSCFLSPIQPAEWYEANEYCKGLESDLVTISSEAEASVVKELFSRSNPSFLNWIGLHYDNASQNFAWVDDKYRNYSLFLPGEPSMIGECVAWVLDDGIDGWQSISCHYSQFFLCRKSAEGNYTFWHYETDGIITSANWPKNYENDEYVTHIIKAPNGSRILLYFETIETETNRDVIQITEKYFLSGNPSISLSGTYNNHSLISKGNQITVQFKSDEDTTSKGFLFRYLHITPHPLKLFSHPDGYITSNNYPLSPKSFIIQNFLIRCDFNHHISFTFRELELDRNDRINIFNGADEKSKKLVTIYMGSSIVETIKSTTNSLFLTYEAAEQYSAANHWLIDYFCIADGNLGEEIII